MAKSYRRDVDQFDSRARRAAKQQKRPNEKKSWADHDQFESFSSIRNQLDHRAAFRYMEHD